MKPMLARTIGPKFNHFPCYVQPKLNGVRALWQNGIFQSRDEKIWAQPILAHLNNELYSLCPDMVKDVVLDGELYVHGWKLQRINGAIAINRKEPRSDTHEVCFHIFDVVNSTQKFSERYLDLMNEIQAARLPHIKAVPTAFASNRREFDQLFHHWTALGYEGIMGRVDAPYEYGEHWSDRSEAMTEYRSKTLWKHKQWEDGEFVCITTTQGEGKADIGIGALVLSKRDSLSNSLALKHLDPGKAYRQDEVFKVGTGFDNDLRIEFMKNPPIGKLIRVRYLCLTDDGVPFNPSFIAVMDQ